jgi:hypothetical protein
VPQLVAPESAHWLSGSTPAGMAVQAPSVPASAQETQTPLQGPAQQTPCWQEPDAHSALAAQATPFVFLPQIVPLQTLAPLQLALVVHAARHWPLVPQTYGSHGIWTPGVQTPAPLQRPADVDTAPVQLGWTQTVPVVNRRQAPCPSQNPSVPQVGAP